MQLVRVHNWRKFQHYRDRSPPWIKVHRGLLNDYEFGRLHDASKLHLMLIWVLAAELDNLLPADGIWLAMRIGVRDPVDVGALLAAGFLENVEGNQGPEHVASTPLAPRQQLAIAEGEGEGETEPTIVVSADAEPDVEQPEERPRRKANLGALKAIAVLNLVKEKHGLAWRKPHEYLVAWLQDKAVTAEDAVLLVEFKIFDWAGSDYERFSRNQKTLFQASKREDYLFDAKLWDSQRSKETERPEICGVIRDDYSIEFGIQTCIADPKHEGDHDWSTPHPHGDPPQDRRAPPNG